MPGGSSSTASTSRTPRRASAHGEGSCARCRGLLRLQTSRRSRTSSSARDWAACAAARTALADVGLEWAADVSAGELAGPELRLLAVSAALATEPRVLLLDEPSAGASLDDVRRLDALLSRLREGGVAILLVEHNLRLVRAVADRVIVMAAGAVIADGSPEAVAADHDVRTAYLGRAAL